MIIKLIHVKLVSILLVIILSTSSCSIFNSAFSNMNKIDSLKNGTVIFVIKKWETGYSLMDKLIVIDQNVYYLSESTLNPFSLEYLNPKLNIHQDDFCKIRNTSSVFFFYIGNHNLYTTSKKDILFLIFEVKGEFQFSKRDKLEIFGYNLNEYYKSLHIKLDKKKSISVVKVLQSSQIDEFKEQQLKIDKLNIKEINFSYENFYDCNEFKAKKQVKKCNKMNYTWVEN